MALKATKEVKFKVQEIDFTKSSESRSSPLDPAYFPLIWQFAVGSPEIFI